MREKLKKLLIGYVVAIIVISATVTAVEVFVDLHSEEASGGSSSGTRSETVTAENFDVTLNDDGSIHVVDSRTYKFTGAWTLVGEVLDPAIGGDYHVNGVTITDSNGTTELTSVPFDTTWRTTGTPGNKLYSVDEQKKSIYVFDSSKNETKTVVFDYTYTGMIDYYNDASVLYWQLVPRGRSETANNVTATFHLPVPAGESVKPADNVYAWGHTKLDGTVGFNDDGTVSFSIPKVPTGTYAEIRIAYPPTWAADGVYRYDEDTLDKIKTQEQKWADEAEAAAAAQAYAQQTSDQVSLGIAVASALLIVLSLILFFKYGREYKPEFDGEYWRDVPNKELDTATIGRIWRWNGKSTVDITTMLMQLEQKGHVRIEPYQKENKGLLADIIGATTSTSYKIIRVVKDESKLTPLEAATMSLVFDQIAKHANEISIDGIQKAASASPSSFEKSVKAWQKQLDLEISEGDYFEKKGRFIGIGMKVVAFLHLFCCAYAVPYVALICIRNNVPVVLPWLGLGAAVIGSIAIFTISVFMRRRSKNAVDTYAKCKGLKKWFHDFTALDEAIPTDSKVWGELLVYATVFGVSSQVLEALRIRVPELFDESGTFASTPGSCSSFSTDFASLVSTASAFSTSMNAALSTGTSSSSGGSYSSGGSGGGGSSSHGGGGGHSSGGGSFAR